MKPFILGVIPARGGSKGLKDKNIKRLKGIPLIDYTIKAALACTMLDDFLVSTDSDKIRDIALRSGAPVPFLRPRELAQDISPTYLAVRHAVRAYEKKFSRKVHSVVLLQPIAPLRTSQDIDNAVKLYLKNIPVCDSLISVSDAGQYHPQTLYKEDNSFLRPWIKSSNYTKRRQDLSSTLWRNGAIYITKRDIVFKKRGMTGNNMIYYKMPRWKSVNIDDIHSFKMAEIILRNRGRFYEK